MSEEKTHWMEIAGSLDDIMKERLSAMKMPEAEDNLEMIASLKQYGTSHSDQCVADMAIFTRKVLKEECGVNIELYEPEEDDDPMVPLMSTDAVAILEEFYKTGACTFSDTISDIKSELIKELKEGYTDAELSREYFETKDIIIYDFEGLLNQIKQLEGQDMIDYVKHLASTDGFLAMLIEEIILSNL